MFQWLLVVGKIVFPLAPRINFGFVIINGLGVWAMRCTIACNGAIAHWHACEDFVLAFKGTMWRYCDDGNTMDGKYPAF